MPSPTVLPFVAALVAISLWASAFIGIRIGGIDFEPGPLALGRMIVGATVLTLFVALRAVRRRRWPVLPHGRLLLGVVGWGAAWFGVYNLALNAAETRIDAGTTALIVNLAPVLVGVLAGVLLGEGFPRRLMVGLVVALAGGTVIALSTSSGRGDATGVILALGAAVLYAGVVIAQKRLLTHVDALTLTWLGALAGVVVCLAFWPQLAFQAANAPISALAALVYLGVFPTAVGFVFWGYALSRVSAGRLSAFTFISPPIAVLMSWVLLSEAPTALTMVGGGVGLVGVAFAIGVVKVRVKAPLASAQRRSTASPRDKRLGG